MTTIHHVTTSVPGTDPGSAVLNAVVKFRAWGWTVGRLGSGHYEPRVIGKGRHVEGYTVALVSETRNLPSDI